MTNLDVQVKMYRNECLGQTGKSSKTQKRNNSHLICKPNIKKAPLSPFKIFFFLSSPSFSSLCETSFCLWLAYFPLHNLMSKKLGPWELNEVKDRLRQGQLAREQAATARYRRQEDRDQGEGRNRGRTGFSDYILLGLVLSCFLLSLSVFVLSCVILFRTNH
jgi:hypothetical protein